MAEAPTSRLRAVRTPVSSVAVFPDVFVVDPAVGPLHPVPQAYRRLPAQLPLDHGVVRIPAVDALGRPEVVRPLQLDAGDLLDDAHQLVHGDQLARAEVDRLQDLAARDGQRPMDAVVDVHERAGLRAVAPDLDGRLAAVLGLDDLAADRR